jgi:hypothetical protein
MNDSIPLTAVKDLLKQIPSVTLIPDMTEPVHVTEHGDVVEVVTRLVRPDQFNVKAFTLEFGNHKVALHDAKSWSLDNKTTYLVRYAKIPK